MKTKLNHPRRIVSAAQGLAALLFTANLVTAQPAPGDAPPRPERPPQDGQRSPRPDGQRPGGQRPDGQRPDGQRGDFLNLNEEQRTAMKEATEANKEDLAKVTEKMRDARRELSEAVYAEKMDNHLIQQKAEAVGKIDGEMSILRAKIFAKLRPTLTPEQLERLKNVPPEFMAGGFSGFRGAGGPGGTGGQGAPGGQFQGQRRPGGDRGSDAPRSRPPTEQPDPKP